MMKLKKLEAIEYRRQIIIKLQEKGIKQTEIAEITGVTQPYVSRVISMFKQGGLEAIQPGQAKGAAPKLTDKQLQELKDTLGKGAGSYGFKDKIWNCGRVQRVIREMFDVKYCSQHVNRILKKLNYTRQKPQLEDYRKKPEKVEEWKAEKLPEIKKKAKAESRVVGYQDEAGVALLPTCQMTYALKGQTPVLQHESKHYKKLSVAAFITEQGDLYYEVRECNFHKNAIVRFMNNCWASLQTPLLCIWDNASIHTSGEVSTQLHQTHTNPRIRLERTPPYSPELNASEQVWNYVKNVLLLSVFCKTVEELKIRVIEALETIKADKELIKSFFRNKKVGFYT